MRKIRNRAEQSPSPEKEIEELTVKIQKGIDPFAEINTEKNQTEKKDIPQNQNSEDYTFTTETDYLSEIKKFLNRIISGNLPNLNGELTIMNHLGFFKNKTGENSWITIPFEIVNLLENETKGDGKIMILLGSSDKSFRQMNLNVKYSETEYRFAVFAKAGSKEIRNIDFSVSGNPVPDKECKKLREAFSDSKNIIPVEFVPFEKMEGFASSLENFSFIEGNA